MKKYRLSWSKLEIRLTLTSKEGNKSNLGYYEYPSLKVGYESTKVFYWRNFTDGITVSYSDSYITYFQWYNVFDDYVFD